MQEMILISHEMAINRAEPLILTSELIKDVAWCL